MEQTFVVKSVSISSDMIMFGGMADQERSVNSSQRDTVLSESKVQFLETPGRMPIVVFSISLCLALSPAPMQAPQGSYLMKQLSLPCFRDYILGNWNGEL